ncbi:MAG TPA: O-antigen ligase family protein [Exilispira sp.]|nr:O-antigen ligase family protein [Exilispira sp.]
MNSDFNYKILLILIIFFIAAPLLSISSMYVFQVLLILIAIYFFLKYKEPIFNAFSKPFIFSFCLMLSGFVISLIFSYSIKSSISRLPIYLGFFLLLLSFYFIFKDKKIKLNLSITYYLIFFIVICITSLVVFFYILYINSWSFSTVFSSRQTGHTQNSIAFAHIIAQCIFIMIFAIFKYFESFEIEKSGIVTTYIFILFFISFFTLVFLLFTSGSRIPIFAFKYLTLLLGLLLVVFIVKDKIYKQRKKFIYFFLIFLCLIGAFIFINNLSSTSNAIYSNRLKQTTSLPFIMLDYIFHPQKILEGEYTEINFRTGAIYVSFQIIKQRFLTGTGPYAWRNYIWANKEFKKYIKLNMTNGHNDIFQVFSEFGFIYFIGYIFLLIYVFLKLLKLFLIKQNPSSFVLIILFIYYIFAGLTEFVSGHPYFGLYYWAFLGFSLAYSEKLTIQTSK